jgi:hypothetical protein
VITKESKTRDCKARPGIERTRMWPKKHSYGERKESRVHSSALAKLTRLLAGTPSLLVHPDLRWFRKANLAHRRFRALSELEERKDAALHRLRGQ